MRGRNERKDKSTGGNHVTANEAGNGRKHFAPHPMIVEDLIAQGLTILGGTPKIGKSWLALDLALSVAKGVPFLGKPVHKTGVLYY